MFEGTRKADWGLIITVLALHIVLSIWINLYGFRVGLLDVWLFGGLINSTLAANVLLIAVVVVGLLLGLGRLRPRDVGLYQRQIVTALLSGIVIWAVLQLSALAVALMRDSVSVNPLWSDEGGAAIAGSFIEELFGNSLYEEIVFRGFLFVQLLIYFSSRFSRNWVGLSWALVVSQAIFALQHVPNRMWVHDMTLYDAISSTGFSFAVGLLLALIYWRTRNLLLVVVIHALYNEPTAIVIVPDGFLEVLMVALILFWPRSRFSFSSATHT